MILANENEVNYEQVAAHTEKKGYEPGIWHLILADFSCI